MRTSMIECDRMNSDIQDNGIIETFHAAVLDAWERHHLGKPNQAYFKLNRKWPEPRISAATLRRMHDDPYIPDYEKVVAWAVGLGEDPNYWLGLADYEQIPPELLSVSPTEAIGMLRRVIPGLSRQVKQETERDLRRLLNEIDQAGNNTVSGV